MKRDQAHEKQATEQRAQHHLPVSEHMNMGRNVIVGEDDHTRNRVRDGRDHPYDHGSCCSRTDDGS